MAGLSQVSGVGPVCWDGLITDVLRTDCGLVRSRQRIRRRYCPLMMPARTNLEISAPIFKVEALTLKLQA